MPSFDPFRRFRARRDPPASSSGEDSDDAGPPRKASARTPDHGLISRGAPENPFEDTHIPVSFYDTHVTAHPERSAKKPSMSGVVSASVDALQPVRKPSLMRRVSAKLHISIPLKSASDLRSRPSTRTLPADMKPRRQAHALPRATIAVPPSLPNTFVSKHHREAALRERGLLPPRKDFSEQEREADERLRCFPSPTSTAFGGSTEAERFKADWLATNRTSESSDSDCGLPTLPYLRDAKTGPKSMPILPLSCAPPDLDVPRHSCESKTDLPPSGRPCLLTSLPPLSTSQLEVLHEEPSEGPITPAPLSPAYLPVIVSSPVEDSSPPIMAESPVSCTFSSHCPGSTLESHSSDHHPVSERETFRSRGRTTGSIDRPRKPAGPLFTGKGTHSLTNLRRSVTESLRRPSMSSLSSAGHTHSMAQVPRTAISPTMHNLGSIVKETRHIEDAESRRLAEIAFLD